MTASEKTKARLPQYVEDFGAIFERREKIGQGGTEAQRAFLEEVAFRDRLWYRYGYHGFGDHGSSLSDMDHHQRQAKSNLLARLRGNLSDLALLAEVSAPKLDEVERLVPERGQSRLQPWISKLDVLDVLDLEDLCIIVGFAVETFGQEYAKALMTTIESYQGTRKKEDPKQVGEQQSSVP